MNLIPIWRLTAGNTVFVQQVSRKIIRPLDPPSADVHASFNWTINTVIEVFCTVVSVEGLLRLEGSRPGAARGFTGKSARGAGVWATVGVVWYMLVSQGRYEYSRG